jgi:hypothetical protein
MTLTIVRRIVSPLLVTLILLPRVAAAQDASIPTQSNVAKALGFSDSEIGQIESGKIVHKDLAEGSDKELAGVVAAFFTQPLADLDEKALDGKFLEADPKMQVRVWEPDESAGKQFTDFSLGPNEGEEARRFMGASKGGQLNLSAAEIEQFRKLNDAGAVNAELQAMLKARYEAYRREGLKGIVPYARGGNKTVSPGEELAQAINEALPGDRLPDYRKALLNYPGDGLPEMKQRFFLYKQTVEDRPTFTLAHRTSARSANTAVLTEEEYYVTHSYNCNFVIAAGFTVQGGTLVFYMNRTFTDQVAGFGSGMKHGIGRSQMLSNVAAMLEGIREQSSK